AREGEAGTRSRAVVHDRQPRHAPEHLPLNAPAVPRRGPAPLALLLASACALPSRLAAQDRDVELLGLVHGTRPPAAYFELRDRDPDAFRMARGMAAGRGRPARGPRAAAPGVRLDAPPFP